MTVKEFADKYGVSVRRVQVLIKEGRIPAKRVYGHRYEIPNDAEYPDDARFSSHGWIYGHRRRPKNE